jgi:hypothetical protein
VAGTVAPHAEGASTSARSGAASAARAWAGSRSARASP